MMTFYITSVECTVKILVFKPFGILNMRAKGYFTVTFYSGQCHVTSNCTH